MRRSCASSRSAGRAVRVPPTTSPFRRASFDDEEEFLAFSIEPAAQGVHLCHGRALPPKDMDWRSYRMAADLPAWRTRLWKAAAWLKWQGMRLSPTLA